MSGMVVRPAKRSSAKPIIGLYAKSGKGKTLSALFLARGFVGRGGRIGMIESESGRGEAHCDTRVECARHKGAWSSTCPDCSYVGGFEVLPIWDHDGEDKFSPRRYGEAIAEAERQKWDALIVDSASHEWEGEGGVLHMAALNQEAGKKGQDVWRVPKIDHQRHFMLKLMQTPIPLVIVCMRAKYPMIEVYNEEKRKKEWQRSAELEPIQSEDVLFEMFVHGHFDDAHRFQGTKYTKPELADVLRTGEPFTNATGAALARWASGAPATPPPALSDVVASFQAAQTVKDLQAAGAVAQRLSDADKAAAMVAYKEQLERIKAATAAAPKNEEPEPGSNG